MNAKDDKAAVEAQAKADADRKAADDKAAVEAQAMADAEARMKALDDEQGRAVANEPAMRDDKARTLRALNAEFCRDVPQNGRAGAFEPEKGEAFSGDYDVPDGKYRVAGSEWVFEIKGKKVAAVTRATSANDYGGAGVRAV